MKKNMENWKLKNKSLKLPSKKNKLILYNKKKRI